MIFGLDSQVEKALGHVTQIKWKTDVAKKERQVKQPPPSRQQRRGKKREPSGKSEIRQ